MMHRKRQIAPILERVLNRSRLTLRLRVKVTSVRDGDTVEVVTRRKGTPFKVRLHGIDAPELDQPFGEESRLKLTALTLGKVSFVDILCVDRYGRQVGILHNGNPKQSVNKEMIELGMAYNWPSYGMLWGGNNAQVRARSKRVGIWARFGGEIRPWSHRHGGTQTPIEYAKAEIAKVEQEKAEQEQLHGKPPVRRRRRKRHKRGRG